MTPKGPHHSTQHDGEAWEFYYVHNQFSQVQPLSTYIRQLDMLELLKNGDFEMHSL